MATDGTMVARLVGFNGEAISTIKVCAAPPPLWVQMPVPVNVYTFTYQTFVHIGDGTYRRVR